MAPSGRFHRRPLKRRLPPTRQQPNPPSNPNPCCDHCYHLNELGTEFEPWCTHCLHEHGFIPSGPPSEQANQPSSVVQQKAKVAGNYAWRENENEGVIPHSHGGRPCAYSSSSAVESSFGLTSPSGSRSRLWKSTGFKIQQSSQSSVNSDIWKMNADLTAWLTDNFSSGSAASKSSPPGEDMDSRMNDDDDDSPILSPYSGAHDSVPIVPVPLSMKANSQLDPTQINLAESPSREILPSQTQKQKVGCCVRKANMKATSDSSASGDSPPPQVINGKRSGSPVTQPKSCELRSFSLCKEGPKGRPIRGWSPALNYGLSKSCSPPNVNSHDPVNPTTVVSLVKQMRDQADKLATMMLQLENLAIKVLDHSSSGGEGRSEGILVCPGPVRSPKPKDGSSSSKGASESSAGSASVFSASSTGTAFEPPPSSAATSGDVSILSATGSTQASSQSQPSAAATPADKPAESSASEKQN